MDPFIFFFLPPSPLLEKKTGPFSRLLRSSVHTSPISLPMSPSGTSANTRMVWNAIKRTRVKNQWATDHHSFLRLLVFQKKPKTYALKCINQYKTALKDFRYFLGPGSTSWASHHSLPHYCCHVVGRVHPFMTAPHHGNIRAMLKNQIISNWYPEHDNTLNIFMAIISSRFQSNWAILVAVNWRQ